MSTFTEQMGAIKGRIFYIQNLNFIIFFHGLEARKNGNGNTSGKRKREDFPLKIFVATA